MQDRGVHKDPGWSYVEVEGAKATHLKLEQIVAGAVIIYTRKVSGEDYSWNGISFLESILKDVVQSIW